MKRIFLAVLIAMSVFTSVYAEETVPPPAQQHMYLAPTGYAGYYGPGAARMYAATAPRKRSSGIMTWLKSFGNEERDARVAHEHTEDARYQDLKQSQKAQFEALQKDQQNYYQDLSRQNGETHTAVANLGHAVNDRADEICDNILGWGVALLIMAVIALLIYALFFRRRNHRHIEAQTDSVNRCVDSRATNVISRIDLVGQAVSAEAQKTRDEILVAIAEARAALPSEVAAKVKEFDARPIDITVAGHRVVFHQSDEATRREVYQVLKVDSDDHGCSAQSLCMHEYSSRDAACDSIKRTMREFLSGAMKTKADAGDERAKLNLALIKHLVDTKQIEIRKL